MTKAAAIVLGAAALAVFCVGGLAAASAASLPVAAALEAPSPPPSRLLRLAAAPVSCGTEAFAMYQKGEDYKDGADDKIAKGLDGRADYATAVYCIRQSAEAGSPLAAAWLSAAYRDGTAYLPRDPASARQWACRAIQLGWIERDPTRAPIYTPPGGTGGPLNLTVMCQGR
jgi:TPR repeat protein